MYKYFLCLALLLFSQAPTADENIIKTRDSHGRFVYVNAPVETSLATESVDRSVYKWRDSSGRIVYGNRSAAPANAQPVKIANASLPLEADGPENSAPDPDETNLAPEPAPQPLEFVAKEAELSGDKITSSEAPLVNEKVSELDILSLTPDNSGEIPSTALLPQLEAQYGSWPLIGIAAVLLLALVGLLVVLQKLLLSPWRRSTM